MHIQVVNKKDPILALNPFIDKNNVIRLLKRKGKVKILRGQTQYETFDTTYALSPEEHPVIQVQLSEKIIQKGNQFGNINERKEENESSDSDKKREEKQISETTYSYDTRLKEGIEKLPWILEKPLGGKFFK
ncbi:hypothetical protein JTB14_000860 [Gonioctena quinquepunctata]|nr:hypothetical protein JTB14_000860 [Gonioctena quinquepunctata]